jgi:polygalacturonase
MNLRCPLLPLLLLSLLSPLRLAAADYDVRTFGATGDGKTPDTAAINRTIEAASMAGGGTVRFPAGTYLSFSIHLKSHVALWLEAGCTAAPTIRRSRTNGATNSIRTSATATGTTA